MCAPSLPDLLDLSNYSKTTIIINILMGEQKHDQYFLRGIVVPKNLKVR